MSMQAKDLDTGVFLRIIDDKEKAEHCWTFYYEIAEKMQAPHKVVLAKAAALIKRKLMTGCTCGCRGDFELTAAGEERIAKPPPPASSPPRPAP